MDKHISSAAVWDENNPSDSFVKLTQSESVCEKSVSSVSVPTNLDCEKGMEKKRKVLLNCRACSRAKSSYDNHGFECFRCCKCSPPYPCSQSHHFTQRRWDRIFDSLHLTIRVINPSPHHGSTSATQVSNEPSTAVSQAQKSSVTASLFEDKEKTGHMVSPYRSPILSPTRNSFWEDSVRMG